MIRFPVPQFRAEVVEALFRSPSTSSLLSIPSSLTGLSEEEVESQIQTAAEFLAASDFFDVPKRGLYWAAAKLLGDNLDLLESFPFPPLIGQDILSAASPVALEKKLTGLNALDILGVGEESTVLWEAAFKRRWRLYSRVNLAPNPVDSFPWLNRGTVATLTPYEPWRDPGIAVWETWASPPKLPSSPPVAHWLRAYIQRGIQEGIDTASDRVLDPEQDLASVEAWKHVHTLRSTRRAQSPTDKNAATALKTMLGVFDSPTVITALATSLSNLDLQGAGLDTAQLAPVLHALSQWPNLETLVLSGNKLRDASVEVLRESIAQASCRLKVIKVTDTGLGVGGSKILAQALAMEGSFERLRELDVSDNPLLPTGFGAIAQAIGNGCPRIEVLRAENVSLLVSTFASSDQSSLWDSTARALASNPRLHSLWMGNNGFTEANVRSLHGKVRPGPGQWRLLDFSASPKHSERWKTYDGLGLTRAVMGKALDLIGEGRLILDRQAMSESTVRTAHVPVLRGNYKVSSISLIGNQLIDLAWLEPVVSEPSRLRFLDLSENPLPARAVTELIAMLLGNESLVSLRLFSCHLRDQHAAAIIAAVGSHPRLSCLSMGGNKFRAASFVAMHLLLTTRPAGNRLVDLDMSGGSLPMDVPPPPPQELNGPAMETKPTPVLSRLSFAQNELKDRAMPVLVSELELFGRCLKYLSLYGNKLRSDGLDVLLTSLEAGTLPCLEELDLGSQSPGLKAGSAERLVSFLQAHESHRVDRLHLQSNLLREQGVMRLLEVATDPDQARVGYLNVALNGVSAAGTKRLKDFMRLDDGGCRGRHAQIVWEECQLDGGVG